MLSGVQPDDEVIVPTVTTIAPVQRGSLPACLAGLRRLRSSTATWTSRACGASSPRSASSATAAHSRRTTGRARLGDPAGSRLRHPGGRDPILALAADTAWRVVEDASESLGSRYKGRMSAPCAHQLFELQRQQDRDHRRRWAIMTTTTSRPPGPLPDQPGQGGRGRVHSQQRRLQLSDEQRPGGDRRRAVGDPSTSGS